jgi:D-alanyl-D-alanine dipeptidase
MEAAFLLRLVLTICAALALSPASAADMPKDFVYLRDIDPTIRQDMRYAGIDNFTGRKVSGYDAAECVLVRQAAEALKAVQEDVRAKGLSLKVYDCYRPSQAVAAFVAWSKAPDNPTRRPSTIQPSKRRSCFRKATSPRSRAIRAAPPWT